MKKIVMGMAALAMAASIFAADVSAKVDINGNLFGLKADKTLTLGETATVTKGEALTLALDSADWNANMGLSFSDDKSGASFNVSTDNKGFERDMWNPDESTHKKASSPLIGTSYKVWFNAFGLKFQVGATDIALNKEQIDWATETGVGGNNYSINYSNNGFSLDVALANGWMKIGEYDTTKDGDPINGVTKVGGTYVKAAYGADFGTIGAFMNANFMDDRTFGNIKFGAGYSNNFNGIDMFANVWANATHNGTIVMKDHVPEDFKDGIETVGLELFAKGSADALSWAAYAKPTMNLKNKSLVDMENYWAGENKEDPIFGFLDWFGYKVKGTVDYALDACTLCCKLTLEDNPVNVDLDKFFVDGSGLTDNQLGITIEPGVKGKVGACDWEVFGKVALTNKAGTDKKGKRANAMSVAFEVPVSFAVAF